MAKKDAKKEAKKKPVPLDQKPPDMSEAHWALYNEPTDIVQNLRGPCNLNTINVSISKMMAAQWLWKHANESPARLEEIVNLGTIPQAMGALRTEAENDRTFIMGLIHCLSEHPEAQDALMVSKANYPHPPINFLALLWDLLRRGSHSTAFEVSCAATVARLAEPFEHRPKVIEQMLAAPKVWIDLYASTLSAHAKTEAASVILQILGPIMLNTAHIPVLLECFVEEGLVLPLVQCIESRCQDCLQGVDKFGDMCVRLSATILTKLLVLDQAKTIAIQADVVDALIEGIRREPPEVVKLKKRKGKKGKKKGKRKAGRSSSIDTTTTEVEIPTGGDDGEGSEGEELEELGDEDLEEAGEKESGLALSFLGGMGATHLQPEPPQEDEGIYLHLKTKAALAGTLFALCMPANFNEEQIASVSNFHKLARQPDQTAPPLPNPDALNYSEGSKGLVSDSFRSNYQRKSGLKGVGERGAGRESEVMMMGESGRTTPANISSHQSVPQGAGGGGAGSQPSAEAGAGEDPSKREEGAVTPSGGSTSKKGVRFKDGKEVENTSKMSRTGSRSRGGMSRGSSQSSQRPGSTPVLPALGPAVPSPPQDPNHVDILGVLLIRRPKHTPSDLLNQFLRRHHCEEKNRNHSFPTFNKSKFPPELMSQAIEALKLAVQMVVEAGGLQFLVKLCDDGKKKKDGETAGEDGDDEAEEENAGEKKKKKKKKKKKSKKKPPPPGMPEAQEQAAACLRWVSVFPETREMLVQLDAVPIIAKLYNASKTPALDVTRGHCRAVLLSLGVEPAANAQFSECKVPKHLMKLSGMPFNNPMPVRYPTPNALSTANPSPLHSLSLEGFSREARPPPVPAGRKMSTAANLPDPFASALQKLVVNLPKLTPGHTSSARHSVSLKLPPLIQSTTV